MKSGCYNERGGILFIIESSIIIFTRERLFMLSCALHCLHFPNLNVQCIEVKQMNFLLFLRLYF